MQWEVMLFLSLGAATVAGCMVPNRWLPALPNDKLLHFAAFALLSSLALRISHGWVELGYWLGGLFVAGWLIECVQGAAVSGRRFCWLDILANGAGITFVALCAWLYDVLYYSRIPLN